MLTAPSTHASNGEQIALQSVPRLSMEDFRNLVIESVREGARIAALFGQQAQGERTVHLLAVLADGHAGTLLLSSTDVTEKYPALTPECPQAHWFEREIAEQCGVIPQAHPWLKPIRLHSPIPPGVTNFFQIAGEEIHEVAVGPVHAGIIEPGHFRFQCHGEDVLHLEIVLGYQHRGVERALIGGPDKRTIHYMETLAGDTTIGHATAYCQAVEALANCQAPARAQALRGVALELERLANHTGDLGALAGDVGYLPTASYCGRIRGDFLNMTALLCGSRFGRGFVRPGGIGFDLDDARVAQLLERIEQALHDVTVATDLLWSTSSVRARFENAGTVSRKTCNELGLVGPAARACGVERDVRQEFPFGIYRFFQVPVSTFHAGDVFARAYVRWLEIQRSVAFIRDQLKTLPPGSIKAETKSLAADAMVVSLVEGWRGEICHVAMTDQHGKFSHYKIVDPSFHNWIGLAMAMRDQQISDFPMCNKSFNLSYCGHDL
jgi:Ni,Fe-hydrogenase III large subunit